MKKISLFLFACCATFFASAQITGGTWHLTGGGGFMGRTSTSEGMGNSFEIKENWGWVEFGGGYLFTDNIGAGLDLNLESYAQLTEGNKTSSYNNTGAQIYGVYFGPCMAPRFYTYGQVDFGFGVGSSRLFDDDGNEDESQRQNSTQLTFGIRPGIAYFLTPAIALHADFGAFEWDQTTLTNNENSDLKTTDSEIKFFAFSRSLTFGFTWFLGRGGLSF